jgi:hypothetical protein
MKKFQKRLMAIAQSLGLVAKFKDGTLTADEQKQCYAAYKEKYGITFAEDKALNEDDAPEETLLSAEEQQAIAGLFAETDDDDDDDTNAEGDDDNDDDDTSAESDNDEEKPKKAKKSKAPKTQKEAVKKLSMLATSQKKTIETLKNTPEEEATMKTNVSATSTKKVMAMVLGTAPHTASHLFGINDPLFARGKWYNELMVARRSMGEDINQAQKEEFLSAFSTFMQGVKSRAKHLVSNNLLGHLDYKTMAAGESHIDYSDLLGTAGEYIVRRTDLIFAYLRSLPSVGDIFPVVSNVQNKEIAPNADFGELSQGYRSGRIFKGNVRFAAEVYSVVDVMFKYKFSDLIKLEKQYIGYLNREGSNVIKWTFIEWVMVHFGTILHNEQQRRRVSGFRAPQQDVIANPANLAADGIIRALDRTVEELKVLPYTDLGVYDDTSMLTLMESFWDKLTEDLDSTEGYRIHANAKHKQWYIRAYRSAYGTQTDFKGSRADVIDASPDNIVWVPNMPINCYLVWATIPGNVENYEDKPGEMTNFYFERDFEDILTMSRWKEGAGVLRAGVQYKTLAELVASNRKYQWIFMNYPASELTLADSISLKDNILFEVSGDTPVTEVTGADVDKVYKLVAGPDGFTIDATSTVFDLDDDIVAQPGDWVRIYAELEDVNETVDGETVKMTKPTGNFLILDKKISTAPEGV